MISPRNDHNSAFTLLPVELLEAIKETFEETFEEPAKVGKFLSFGQVHQGEMVLRVGYLAKDSISQINFDTSNGVSGSEANIISSLEEMVFGTKELFLDYFKNKNLENFSYHWNPLNENKNSGQIYYKLDSTNTALEEEANRILGEEKPEDSHKSLIIGDMTDSEEIEKIVETLHSSHFTFK